MLKAYPLDCDEGVARCDCGFVVPCRNTVMHVCSVASAKALSCGPGCHLKRLLKTWLGVEAGPGCACEKRAQIMDQKGCDWCLENIDRIVGWLKEEHGRQKVLLPFSEIGARVLIRTAVRNARRTMNS